MSVELDQPAVKDLKRLDSPIKGKIVKVLQQLESSGSVPDNLDIKPIKGFKPWLRLRIGTHRVLFRKMDKDKYLVHRIIHRRDLDRETTKLR